MPVRFPTEVNTCDVLGAGAGIGKETALRCAKFKYVARLLLYRRRTEFHVWIPRSRAKLVLGDVNESAVKSVVADIKRAGG